MGRREVGNRGRALTSCASMTNDKSRCLSMINASRWARVTYPGAALMASMLLAIRVRVTRGKDRGTSRGVGVEAGVAGQALGYRGVQVRVGVARD